MVKTMADITDDYRRVYGTSDVLEMVEADEFTRAHTQKGQTGTETDFPMRGFQVAIGWDKAYFQRASVADMAQTQISAQKSQIIKIRTEMQKAMYLSSNFSFVDYRDTKVTLAVKRFLNADGTNIPDGPQGQTFNGATHTHYLATAAASAGRRNGAHPHRCSSTTWAASRRSSSTRRTRRSSGQSPASRRTSTAASR
jgi:hypothetical protein